jgi:hypothetical protein
MISGLQSDHVLPALFAASAIPQSAFRTPQWIRFY